MAMALHLVDVGDAQLREPVEKELDVTRLTLVFDVSFDCVMVVEFC